MRIITWNCDMAFRKKADLILAYKPDILIVPECEHPDKLKFKSETLKPTSTLWFGKNRNKGLCIFSYGNFQLKVLEDYNDNLKTIIPISVSSDHFNFNLFAVWAYNPNDMDGRYIVQVWKAIHYYDAIMTNNKTFLIGDFNSNTIWDYKRSKNHSSVVKLLEDKGIHSLYHYYHKQNQGQEVHPTFYMYRHKSKPYHIDYCFSSEDMIQHLQSVEIGDFDYWIKYSDHVPIIVTFNNVAKKK